MENNAGENLDEKDVFCAVSSFIPVPEPDRTSSPPELPNISSHTVETDVEEMTKLHESLSFSETSMILEKPFLPDKSPEVCETLVEVPQRSPETQEEPSDDFEESVSEVVVNFVQRDKAVNDRANEKIKEAWVDVPPTPKKTEAVRSSLISQNSDLFFTPSPQHDELEEPDTPNEKNQHEQYEVPSVFERLKELKKMKTISKTPAYTHERAKSVPLPSENMSKTLFNLDGEIQRFENMILESQRILNKALKSSSEAPENPEVSEDDKLTPTNFSRGQYSWSKSVSVPPEITAVERSRENSINLDYNANAWRNQFEPKFQMQTAPKAKPGLLLTNSKADQEDFGMDESEMVIYNPNSFQRSSNSSKSVYDDIHDILEKLTIDSGSSSQSNQSVKSYAPVSSVLHKLIKRNNFISPWTAKNLRMHQKKNADNQEYPKPKYSEETISKLPKITHILARDASKLNKFREQIVGFDKAQDALIVADSDVKPKKDCRRAFDPDSEKRRITLLQNLAKLSSPNLAQHSAKSCEIKSEKNGPSVSPMRLRPPKPPTPPSLRAHIQPAPKAFSKPNSRTKSALLVVETNSIDIKPVIKQPKTHTQTSKLKNKLSLLKSKMKKSKRPSTANPYESSRSKARKARPLFKSHSLKTLHSKLNHLTPKKSQFASSLQILRGSQKSERLQDAEKYDTSYLIKSEKKIINRKVDWTHVKSRVDCKWAQTPIRRPVNKLSARSKEIKKFNRMKLHVEDDSDEDSIESEIESTWRRLRTRDQELQNFNIGHSIRSDFLSARRPNSNYKIEKTIVKEEHFHQVPPNVKDHSWYDRYSEKFQQLEEDLKSANFTKLERCIEELRLTLDSETQLELTSTRL